MTTARNAGVIGLGAMGLGMAQSLRRAGWRVHAYDLRSELAHAFAAAGGVACATPAEVAAASDVIVSVVFDADQTEQVLFGARGVAQAMRPGAVFVMCSTVAPELSAGFEQRLGALGGLFLDAPVSGAPEVAAAGGLTWITAGTAQAQQAAAEALGAMAAHVYHVGGKAGDASAVKLINQLLVGVHLAAASEAMAFALRQGIDPKALYEVIRHSAGNSNMFERHMPRVIEGDYSAVSALNIHVKDLGLVLQSARTVTFPLPLAAAAHQMYLQAAAAGLGGEGSQAVIKVFPGIDLPGTQTRPA